MGIFVIILKYANCRVFYDLIHKDCGSIDFCEYIKFSSKIKDPKMALLTTPVSPLPICAYNVSEASTKYKEPQHSAIIII